MNEKIIVNNNRGIISTGKEAKNTLVIISDQSVDEINWEKLSDEIKVLKTSPDKSIRKFADESSSAIEEEDPLAAKTWLAKWIPCIGDLIKKSYYILEIASKLGV